MKILFNIKSLASKGGAERALLGLAGELARRGHQVDITVRDRQGAQSAYPIPENVSVIHLAGSAQAKSRSSLSAKLFPNQHALRTHVSKNRYDAIVGWLRYGGSMVGWLPKDTAAVRISAMRNLPYNVERPQDGFKKLVKFYHRRAGFGRADEIFVQMPQFVGMLPKTWQGKSVVIPNAVAAPMAAPLAYEAREKLVIAVARLVPVKRLDQLISGFALFHAQYPDWKLEIWGQSEPRAYDELQSLIIEQGLQDSVALMGITDHIDQIYKRARIMVHPSRREGMSNAVAEAMAHGLTLVACADCSGMCEMVRDGETGLLIPGAPGEEPLAVQIGEALSALAGNDEKAAHLGTNAIRHIINQFSHEVVYDRWEEALKNAVNRHSKTDSALTQPHRTSNAKGT